MRSRLALLALLPALALSACAGDGDTTASPSPTEPATATSTTSTTAPPSESTQQSSPSPLPTLAPPTAPPSTPSDSYQEVTVTGVITTYPGDCVTLLDANAVVWSLRGDRAGDLTDGQTVTVTGTSFDDRDASCLGTPLRVTNLR